MRRSIKDIEEKIRAELRGERERLVEEFDKNVEKAKIAALEQVSREESLRDQQVSFIEGLMVALAIVRETEDTNEQDRAEDEGGGPRLLPDEGSTGGVGDNVSEGTGSGGTPDDAAMAGDPSSEQADYDAAVRDELAEG